MHPMTQYANCAAQFTIIRDQAKSILEIGTRDGHDAEKLRKLFKIDPKRVYLVEANPEQAIKVKENYPSAKTFEFAVSNVTGTMEFNKVDQSQDENRIGTSSLLDRPGFYADDTEKIEVQTQTAQYLMSKIEEEEIDLCKIDVEGYTFEVLESFKDSLRKVKTFHLECEHIEIWKGQKTYEVVKSYMESNGYIQLFFTYTWGATLQSDSIWARENICKGRSKK